MKKTLSIIVFSVLYIALSSCSKCKTCRYVDTPQTQEKICGKDLKAAEKDTAHYHCQ